MNEDKITTFWVLFLIAAFHNYLYTGRQSTLWKDTPILSASETGIYLIRRCCRENGHSLIVSVIL